MWKDYSTGYLKNNRASGISIITSAFITALLFALLCSLFYNLWKYEIERIELEEGGWQSRITGELSPEDVETIAGFATVKAAVVNEKESAESKTAVDLYFNDRRAVFSDTQQIAERMGLLPEAVTYHYELLAMYLIRDSKDTAPRLVFPLFILITGMASLSLILIIHNSFAVSMNARIHQFGIFSSIGATPKQIRTCLLQEAAALCALPVLAGNLAGIGCGMGLLELSNILLGTDIVGRHRAVFGFHPLVLAFTLAVTAITIWISAWLPAKKLSEMTPLEAIKNTGEFQLKHRRNSFILASLFGMEGELAGNALKAQQKALRTASLSLLLSFLAFTLMQCFFSLSAISTRETYFERYQDVWDIMVTVKDTEADSFEKTDEIREIEGVESVIVYQKAMAKRIVTEAQMSEEMKTMGGFSHASDRYVARSDQAWLVNAPVVILDDASFLQYCAQTGIAPRLDGAIIRNQIRNVTNPDFRHPQYMPYIKEEKKTSVLRRPGDEEITAEVPVLAYTAQVPALREEYAALDYYELVHFIPVSLWKEIKERLSDGEKDTYICVLGKENITPEELYSLQCEIDRKLGKAYETEIENRIQEYETNDRQIRGMMAILGSFCVLLAVIGVGNIFSNTLGFVRQRKREFARYMAVGMTPGGMKKMFFIEALALAGRPVLLTLPAAIIAVGGLLKASYVEPGEFLAEAPLLPIGVFWLAIWGTVALAYYLGWHNMRKINPAGVLSNDTMM